MTKDSTTVLIKKEPDVLQQEQDNLIFSYLNANYMSTNVAPIDNPPSPPYSTSSGSTDTVHLNNTDIDMLTDSSPPTTTATTFCVEDPFFLQLQTALSEQGIPWPTTTATTFATSAATTIPFPGVQDPSCLMNIHPLMLPTPTTANTTVTTNQNTILSQPLPPSSYLPIDNNNHHHTNNTRSYSFSSSSSSSSDNEQSKKKRTGRKKREISIAPAPLKSLTPILPAASMATTTTTTTSSSLEKENHHHVGKANASSVNSSLDKIPSSSSSASSASSSSSSSNNNNNNNNTTAINSNSNNNMNHTNNNNNSNQPIAVEKTAAEIAYAKRQERLIKNRAAALLSRKRKREHLTTLEEERQKLLNENTELKTKVDTLEDKISTLEKENLELKNKLSSSSTTTTTTTTTSLSSPISFLSSQKFNHHHHHHLATPKHAKTTGMVFMIILFSFALFTLPSSHTSDQLTVGGSPKPNIPLIGPSTSRIPDIKLESIENNSDETTTLTTTESKTEEEENKTNTIATTITATNPISTTDLILINRVQPKDLHSWVKNKLIQNQNNGTTELIQWNRNDEDEEKTKEISETTSNHLYLYTKEFSQLGLSSSSSSSNNNIKQDSSTIGSTLSIICPLNTTSHCETTTTSVDAYLQIDVLVIGSRVLQGELKHQFKNEEEDEDMAFNDQALLNNIKDEMIQSILFKSSSPSPSSSSPYMINDYSSLNPINDHTKKTILNRRKIRRKLLDEKRKRFSRVVLE
ncbi:unnamed protein product [Cunninghamella echinulata]